MDLTRIRYFLELASELNFSSAANRLGISQPALTKAIARLEFEVGGKLIRREGKYTHLTSIGAAMREQFIGIDVAVKQAESLAARYQRKSFAQLRIGVVSGVGPKRAAGFLVSFLKRYPGTRIKIVDVQVSVLAQSLLTGEIDCAFVVRGHSDRETLDDERLHVLDLYQEPLVVIESNGDRASVCPQGDLCDCRSRPRVGRIAWDPGNESVESAENGSLHCVPLVTSTRDDWTQALVLAGLGPALVPMGSVLTSELKGEVAESAEADRVISLVIPTGRVDTVEVQQFLTMAQKFVW